MGGAALGVIIDFTCFAFEISLCASDAISMCQRMVTLSNTVERVKVYDKLESLIVSNCRT